MTINNVTALSSEVDFKKCYEALNKPLPGNPHKEQRNGSRT